MQKQIIAGLHPDLPAAAMSGKTAIMESVLKQHSPNTLTLLFTGQIKGGKNNMVVTRTGQHFPKKSWAIWRDAAVREIVSQLPPVFTPIDKPCNMTMHYVSGDKHRRDMPAIIDAIFHVLEKAGVVTDDTLLWVSQSSRAHDKANPYTAISIEMP